MNNSQVDIRIGADSLEQLPDLVRKYGSHPLLVHGHRPVEDGLLEKVRVVLTKAGIPHSNMGQILPNPKFSSVSRGIAVAKAEGCDIILALGGGSTLQCAKGIAYGMKCGSKNLWKLWTGKEKASGMMTVGSVLTNPATGDELDNACTLVKNGEQKTLSTPYGYCTFAVLDPRLSALPFYPTMCQVFEMFMFLFVRYLDCAQNEEETDLGLMKELLAAAKVLETDQSDVQARTQLFQVGLHAHQLKQTATAGIAHLANKLAYHWSMPDGAALSCLFFAWSEGLEDTPKLDRMAKVLYNKDSGKEGLREIKAFVKEMQLPVSIKDAGLVLTKKELKKLASSHEEYELLKKARK